MGFQLWLADVLRGAGLTVHEVAGWRTRSADEDEDASTFSPRGVIIHETRGSATLTDAGEIGVLINGRVGLSGPIAQLYVGRNGHWHVVAGGLCHHVKTGWGGPFSGLGNSRLLGIEPAHSADEDWADKPVQYASYVAGVAAILRHTGWPAPVGHKEHQPGDKPDPEFSMAAFRADVAAVLAGEDDDMSRGDDIWRLLEDGLRPPGTAQTAGGGIPVAWLPRKIFEIQAAQTQQQLRDEAILAAVRGDEDQAAILARIDQRAAELVAGQQALRAELAAELAPMLAAALRDELADLPVDQMDAATERALRRVLGSIDGATPA